MLYHTTAILRTHASKHPTTRVCPAGQPSTRYLQRYRLPSSAARSTHSSSFLLQRLEESFQNVKYSKHRPSGGGGRGGGCKILHISLLSIVVSRLRRYNTIHHPASFTSISNFVSLCLRVCFALQVLHEPLGRREPSS